MIGTLPMRELAPLDYRYALDAAMSTLAGPVAPLVLCNLPELTGEVAARIPHSVPYDDATGALWVEPLVGSWQADMIRLTRVLPCGAPLAIVASRPLARLVPERHTWRGHPLGMQIGGVQRLRR